jgi:hypothetical protein
VIRCWSCGAEVAVGHPDQSRALTRAQLNAVSDVRRSSAWIILGGSVLITLALLVPRAGLLLALGLIAFSVRGYASQIRAAADGRVQPDPEVGAHEGELASASASGPDQRGMRPSLLGIIGGGCVAVAAALVLVAPFLVRNRGYALPPPSPAPGVLGLMSVAFLGWLVMPVVLLVVYAQDHRGPLPPRLTLTGLARNPLALLSALLVLPMGLLATEGLVALIAWEQGQLPMMVADLLPPPQFDWVPNGRQLSFDYDGLKIKKNITANINSLDSVYLQGLRRGFTLTASIPPSLSVGLLEVRTHPYECSAEPPVYLATRIVLTLLILFATGGLLAVQARWLGLIAALASRHPLAPGRKPTEA